MAANLTPIRVAAEKYKLTEYMMRKLAKENNAFVVIGSRYFCDTRKIDRNKNKKKILTEDKARNIETSSGIETEWFGRVRDKDFVTISVKYNRVKFSFSPGCDSRLRKGDKLLFKIKENRLYFRKGDNGLSLTSKENGRQTLEMSKAMGAEDLAIFSGIRGRAELKYADDGILMYVDLEEVIA